PEPLTSIQCGIGHLGANCNTRTSGSATSSHQSGETQRKPTCPRLIPTGRWRERTGSASRGSLLRGLLASRFVQRCFDVAGCAATHVVVWGVQVTDAENVVFRQYARVQFRCRIALVHNRI